MSFDYGLCLLAAFLASLVSGLGGFGGGFIIVLFLAPVVGPKAVIPLVAAYFWQYQPHSCLSPRY